MKMTLFAALAAIGMAVRKNKKRAAAHHGKAYEKRNRFNYKETEIRKVM